jgi:chromosome segregation ATPase
MPLPRTIRDLFDWKTGFLNDKITAINNEIAADNAKMARLRRMKDTDSQIEGLENRNERLEQEKKEIEDELDRFNRGKDGKKYNMAKRNIGNEINRLHRAGKRADLAAADILVGIEKAATEAVADGALDN